VDHLELGKSAMVITGVLPAYFCRITIDSMSWLSFRKSTIIYFHSPNLLRPYQALNLFKYSSILWGSLTSSSLVWRTVMATQLEFVNPQTDRWVQVCRAKRCMEFLGALDYGGSYGDQRDSPTVGSTASWREIRPE
jgi:hypothetical protein